MVNSLGIRANVPQRPYGLDGSSSWMSRSLKDDWGRNSIYSGMKSNTVRIQERLTDTEGIKSLVK